MSDTSFLLRRTCTELSETSGARERRSLEDYRSALAYVLLGDPGSGKTASFEREAIETDGRYVTARDFLTFSPEPGAQGKTLFIDALDEMRIDDGDGRTPLDNIRRRLDELGCPSFRLSCRAADWFGDSDRQALQAIAPSGALTVLSLDPLTDDDVAHILGNTHGLTPHDVEQFLSKADANGLSDLLRNPQVLELLVKAVGKNWPRSRAETYAMACRELVSEINPEHRHAKRGKRDSPDTLLAAAGYLCAVQLLCNATGYISSIDAMTVAETQYLDWEKLPALPDFASPSLLLSALKTKLFNYDGEQHLVPIHRSVAEHLGACYLAAAIERGLPVGRALALMAGDDGGIVTDLRGLAACLSIHCQRARTELIARDPLGVVLYGDVRDFSADDKRKVLLALQGEAQRYPWFRSEDWRSSPFGALATPDMLPIFREVLSSAARTDIDQAMLDCALDALRNAPTYPELDDALDAIARDASHRPHLRRKALQVQFNDLPRTASRCVQLAQDIRSGAVEDRDDSLLGALLKVLYPQHIPPTEIFRYLRPLKYGDHLTDCHFFWEERFLTATPNEMLPTLLDQYVLLEKTADEFYTFNPAGELLVRGLEVHGDTISDEQLDDWLGVGLDEYENPWIKTEHQARIQQWFYKRPQRYWTIRQRGIMRCLGQEESASCLFHSAVKLYDATPPNEIGPWYLEQAINTTNVDIAQYYFAQAVAELIRQGGERTLTPVALEFLESWLVAHPQFQPCLEVFISSPIDHWRHKQAVSSRANSAHRQARRNEWVALFREHIPDIRQGRAHPKILHDLARVYLREQAEAKGATPAERLHYFFDGDVALLQATREGLRRVLTRDDLPSVADIVKLSVKEGFHYLREACLAGMAECYEADPVGSLQLDETLLAKLLAFQFFQFSYVDNKDPLWLGALVQARPRFVADVLVAYAVPMLRKGKPRIAKIYELAYSLAWGDVARTAVPELLKRFPIRARIARLENDLDPLLKAGMRYLDQGALSAIVSTRLAQPSMDDPQRVYWLACGLLLTPAIYTPLLAQHVGRSTVRRNHLGSFLVQRLPARHNPCALPIRELPESALSLLVELLAPESPAEHPTGFHRVSLAMQIAEVVHVCIDALASNPSDAATHTLEHLSALFTLTAWKNPLQRALYTQGLARRRANFHAPDAQAVCRALANLQPANAADLAALVFDHLHELARKIRDGSTNDYRQYWSHDASNKKLVLSKPENDCRDALLSDLKERLALCQINAAKEGYYVEDKRADIKVSYRDCNVPIEIKKDSHADLWRAIREQLIEKYVRDPGTGGYGIYLVLWFGAEGAGKRKFPDSPQALKAQLQQTLTQEERQRILICVFDCALP